MNTTEIAAALLAATTLTEETTASIREYRRAKRATGAPVDLEDAVLHAADKCQEAMESLREYLEKARREADERAVALAHNGGRMGQFTWFVLDGRKTAEDLNARLCAARERFGDAVRLWAVLADRIVAAPDDVKRHAEERRARCVDAWLAKPVRDIRAAAKAVGVPYGAPREDIVCALAAAGVEP